MLKEKLKNVSSLDVFSGIGILLFLVGCPYFLSDRYYSMTLAKTLFFIGCSAFFFLGCLILRRALKKRVRIPLIRKNRTELYFLLFIGLAVVSCALAEDPMDAFAGGKGRNMGLMMFLFIWFAYVAVSRFGQFRTPVAVIFGASLVGVDLIAFLQFCRLDPFGLYAGTKEIVRTSFMTLLGNKDVYYSYLSLALPFALYLIFEAQSLREKIFWYAVSWTGFIGVLVCNSEGGYVCLAVSFLFFLLAKCKDKANLLTFLRIVMLFMTACALISLLRSNFAKGNIREELLTKLFISPIFWGVGLPVSVGLYVLLLKKEPPERFFAVMKKAVVIAVAVAAAVLIGLFVYFTFINTTVRIKRWAVFFRFGSASWGSGRSTIWKNMIEIYGRLPVVNQLFGAGEESIAALMNRYLPEAVAANEKILDNAHNEYLQYLVTHGLLGLIAYVLFVVSAVKRGFKEGGRYQRAAALAACCYLVQASYNLMQAITTPMFFVFLALMQTHDIAVPKKVRAGAVAGDPAAEATPAEDAPAEASPGAASDGISPEEVPAAETSEPEPPVTETPAEETSVTENPAAETPAAETEEAP